jgi:signal transduction histidine kinase
MAEILPRLGNATVIERPVRTSTFVALIRSTQRARARQYDVRRHLSTQQKAEKEREEALASERAARGDAERASRVKDEFLATLSHELRTPLSAVLGWSRVLKSASQLPEDVMNGLSTIERNARVQAQIIEDLLDMSSILSGMVRLDVQPVDLIAVLEATVETVRPTADAKGVRLQVVLDPRAGPISGDPNRLQQIFWNLLSNAVKFTPREGRVMVKLARVNSHLEVEVADTGEGIDPAFLPHVFERFRQADASTARRHGGLGLGLSIVRQLVELHGGSISARSAGPGKGSTFRVMVPVMPIHEEILAGPGSREHPRHSTRVSDVDRLETVRLDAVSVLVVDDQLDSRALI